MSEVENPAEKIHESRQHSEHADDRRVGLMISICAVLLAVTAALGKKCENAEIVHRVNASNTWAYYQAKRIRGTQTELSRDLVRALAPRSTTLADKYESEIERYRKEGEEITAQAKHEEERGEKAEQKGDYFDICEVLFQIAIVLCSVTILTKQWVFYRTGIAVSSVAVALAIYAFFWL